MLSSPSTVQRDGTTDCVVTTPIDAQTRSLEWIYMEARPPDKEMNIFGFSRLERKMMRSNVITQEGFTAQTSVKNQCCHK